MYEHLTRITPEDVATRPAVRSEDEATRYAGITALLSLASLVLPVATYFVVAALIDNPHVAGALCFLCYSQLAYATSSRRALTRRNGLIELFYLDQRRAMPRVDTANLGTVLSGFARRHRQLVLVELIGIPLAGVLMMLGQAARAFALDHWIVSALLVAGPVVLVASIASFLRLLHILQDAQRATFETPERIEP